MENVKKFSYGIGRATALALAYISMLIDHIARGIIYHYVVNTAVDASNRELIAFLRPAYKYMRYVGRLAFPVFCLLLTEGFYHTRDRKRYGLRLLVFAIISEIPFDLMQHRKLFDLSSQNVMWTLLAGLIMMCLIEKLRPLAGQYYMIAGLLICGLTTGVTYLCRTDYKYSGIPLIFALYIFRDYRLIRALAGFVTFYLLTKNLFCLPAFLIVYLYNTRPAYQGPHTDTTTSGSHSFDTPEAFITAANPDYAKAGAITSRARSAGHYTYLIYPVHLLLFYLIYGLISSL